MPNYTGNWQLIPELCCFPEGEVPHSGLYCVAQHEGVVTIKVRYSTSQVEDAKLEYGGPVDGSKIVIEQPPITHASFQQVGDFELDSSAFINEEVIVFARRLVSHDRSLMSVWEIHHNPDGSSFVNTQFYKRV